MQGSNSLGSTYNGDGSPTTYRGSAAVYDPESRLVSLGVVTNAYTSDGLRAVKRFPGAAVYYLYDGEQPVCELNASGVVTAVHTFGPNGLLAREFGTNGGANTVYYTWDPSGNLAQRVSTSGNVIDSAVFDGFGAQASTDNTGEPFSGLGGQWGGYYDAQDGLTLLTHREYDAGAGRFLTRDPLGYGGGVNLYAYCQNDSVNWEDPLGFAPVSPTPAPPITGFGGGGYLGFGWGGPKGTNGWSGYGYGGFSSGGYIFGVGGSGGPGGSSIGIFAYPGSLPPFTLPPSFFGPGGPASPGSPGGPGNPANPTTPSSPTGPSGPGHSPAGANKTGNTVPA